MAESFMQAYAACMATSESAIMIMQRKAQGPSRSIRSEQFQ
jgi:hypothetical protein